MWQIDHRDSYVSYSTLVSLNRAFTGTPSIVIDIWRKSITIRGNIDILLKLSITNYPLGVTTQVGSSFFYFFEKKKFSPPGRANRLLPVQTVSLTLDFEIWRTLWPLVARQKHSRALRIHTGSNLCRCFWNPWSFTLVQSSWVKMGRWEEFIGNPKPIWARRTKRKKKQGKS